MKRSIIGILLSIVLFATDGFCQTKIYLTSPEGRFEDYKCVNASDSAFVKVGHSEVIGTWYTHHYELRTNIPDGKYEIYVNGTLEFSGAIKNFKRNDIWRTYYPNGAARCETPYIAGIIDGDLVCYYQNGTVSYKAKYIRDKISGIAFEYDESGEISAKSFYVNGEFIKQDIFDKNGHVESKYPDQ